MADDGGYGFFVGATPDWQLAQQRVNAGNAFSGGVPTDAAGNPDLGAMAKTLLQKGDLANGTALLQAGIGQQQLASAGRMIGGMSGWMQPGAGTDGGPIAQSSAAPIAPTSDQSGSAMPLFRNAIKKVESGGDYNALGPTTKSGDQAFGAYQVMGANIGPWTKEVLGREMTPTEFLGDHDAQDAVFDAKFGQSLRQYGNPRDAASVWFTGRPYAQGAGSQDVLGTTGSGYVSKFMSALPGYRPPQPTTAATSPASSTPTAIRVAQSDNPDEAPSSTHPYGASPAVAAGNADQAPPSLLPNSTASAPPSDATTGSIASASGGSRQAPMPTSFAAPPAPSPNAGSLTDPADPTYGGQVPRAWIAAGHSAADWVQYQRRMASVAGLNPYLKAAGEQWAKSAEDLQASINKQAELTTEQKNARDPVATQAQINLATTRARARVDAQTDSALVPVTAQDGTVNLMPKRVALAQAAAGNLPTQSLPGYVTSGQQNLLTKLNDGTSAFQQRQVAGERLDAMSDLLSTFQTGANSQAFNDAVAKARSLGIEVPNTATVNPAAMQQFVKNGYANVLSTMSEQGNKQFVSELQSAIASNPNPDLQPEANAAMIAQMQGIRAYHDANQEAYSKWYAANKGASNDAAFQIGWAKQNPVSRYVTAARREIAPLGMPVPPKSQLVDGQAYMVKGAGGQSVKARWSASANGFVPIGAAR